MSVTRDAGRWVLVVALAAGANVAASASRSMSVEVKEPAKIAGQELPVGSYTIAWTGDTAVTFKVSKGRKVIAEGTGHFEERTTPAGHDSVVFRKDGAGHPVLSEIRFGGKKSVLVLAAS